MRFPAFLICVLLAAVPLFAADSLFVAAAASLRPVFEDGLIPAFEKKYPGIIVEGTFDASGKLQVQIENGLAADVFVSAAEKQMEALVRGGYIDGASVRPLLKNEIVLIKPAGGKTRVTDFAGAEKADGIVALGDPRSVPAGWYAKIIFERLGSWAAVEKKASFATNVTEVLNQVATGNAEIGVVYATDAAAINRTGSKVEVIAKAQAPLAPPVVYPAGVMAAAVRGSAGHLNNVRLFTGFLFSAEAAAIFTRYGFTR